MHARNVVVTVVLAVDVAETLSVVDGDDDRVVVSVLPTVDDMVEVAEDDPVLD